MTTTLVGRSLELRYIDGQPDGMLTAELFNWTGHVLMAPRTQIKAMLARKEASYAGVYLLVGEGEDIGERIRAHDVRKEWWTSAVLVTAAANKLNKAHARYLEAKLIAQARAIGRVPLDNATNPPLPGLSEADAAKMEAFLENLFVVLPAVGVDMFIQRSRPMVVADAPAIVGQPVQAASSVSSLPLARFTLQNRAGLSAAAFLAEGEFVVEAGSSARKERVNPSQGSSYALMHAELRRAHILEVDGERCRFTRNYAFRSPSAAAAIVIGRSANGTVEWKEAGTGIAYKEWEARHLGASVKSGA